MTRPANKIKLEEIEAELSTWRTSQLEELETILHTLIQKADEKEAEEESKGDSHD